MDPIKVDFTQKGSGRGGALVIPPEKSALKIILSVLGALAAGAISYYFMYPALNFKDLRFYACLGITFGAFILLMMLQTRVMSHSEYAPYVKRTSIVPGIFIGILVLIMLIGGLTSWQLFRARDYSKIMDVQTNSNFSTDVPEPDFGSIPKLDQEAALNLANRALSNLADMGSVSQFTILNAGDQINYKQTPVRVATLQYANIIKWFTNTGEGLPGYIIIDMANENTEFVQVEKNIRYTPAEHFNRFLNRQLRFQYPTALFGTPTFEIDEAGNPYWVCPVLDKTVGMFGGSDVIGIVLLDAVTGKSQQYSLDAVKTDASLQWIDRVYSSDLLVEQYNYYGSLRGGFWNSILGQRDVLTATEGYNYIAKDDDVYMYTGITSVTSDQSITGFLLINQRTKETHYYRVNGAKEETARQTAEGLVLDYGYTATFPLLLNISGEPTYFMALKDEGQVVQRYALINVKNYNKIKAIGSSISECLNLYVDSLAANGIKTNGEILDTPEADAQTITGKVTEIRSAVISGETVYYIRLESSKTYFKISASKSEAAIILNVGDSVTISYDGELNTAIKPAKDLK